MRVKGGDEMGEKEGGWIGDGLSASVSPKPAQAGASQARLGTNLSALLAVCCTCGPVSSVVDLALEMCILLQLQRRSSINCGCTFESANYRNRNQLQPCTAG